MPRKPNEMRETERRKKYARKARIKQIFLCFFVVVCFIVAEFFFLLSPTSLLYSFQCYHMRTLFSRYLSLSTFETLVFVLKLKLSIHQIWWWSGGCQRIRPNEWREKIEQIQCVWYKLMSRMSSFTGESNKHRVESLHSKLQSRLTTMIHLIIN